MTTLRDKISALVDENGFYFILMELISVCIEKAHLQDRAEHASMWARAAIKLNETKDRIGPI